MLAVLATFLVARTSHANVPLPCVSREQAMSIEWFQTFLASFVMAQLCIYHLLSNIYTCSNGNKASSYMLRAFNALSLLDNEFDVIDPFLL